MLGAASGLLLAGAYIAGGAARTSAGDAHLAAAAASGFSESALRAEVSAMPPGALAVARRHDPYTAAGAPERDRQTAELTARLIDTAQSSPAGGAQAPLLRTSLSGPAASVEKSTGALSNARALDCLSQAVYYEARGESQTGQAAVAQVVLNRLRRPGFPKTVCGVVYQGIQDRACQFSFACDGSARAPKEPEAWRKARAVAARAMGGFVLAQVGDATHFHVASLGAVWGQGLVRVAQIGAHSFYRLTGRTSTPSHSAPGVYGGPSELAEKPVYAEAKATPADMAGSKLILAAAVTPAPSARTAADAAPGAQPSSVATQTDKPVADAPVQTQKVAG